MSIWVIAFAASTILASVAFVVFAVLWLRKLREALTATLSETANQQIRSAQRLSESLAQLQIQQQHYDKKLLELSEGHLAVKKELHELTDRVRTNETGSSKTPRSLH